MKRILLSGYYGFQNTGDEAILAALIAGLRRSFDDLEIIVLSADPDYTMNLHQVKSINRLDFKAIITELKTADLLISGGGSLLQDITSYKTIPYYLGLIVIAKIMKTPVFFCAQGVGPINKRLNKKLVAKILNKVDLISVRDQNSKEVLQNCGVEQKITVTADLVFNLLVDNNKICSKISQQENINLRQPTIAVSVRPWGDNSYLDKLVIVLDDLTAKLGVQMLLIPFHYPDDKEISQLLKKRLTNKVNLIKGNYNPQELLAIVSECDLMVGVRLHSLVFAVVAGVPVAGISYDPKVDSFLAQLELESVAEVDNIAPKQMEEEVIKMWEQKDKQVEERAHHVTKLKKLAAKNFSLLQEKLGV